MAFVSTISTALRPPATPPQLSKQSISFPHTTYYSSGFVIPTLLDIFKSLRKASMSGAQVAVVRALQIVYHSTQSTCLSLLLRESKEEKWHPGEYRDQCDDPWKDQDMAFLFYLLIYLSLPLLVLDGA